MIQAAAIPSHNAPRRRLWLGLGFGLIGLLTLAVLLFAIFQPVKVLPRIRLAPGFSLLEAGGDQLTSADLAGQIVLYTFSYTRCPEPCGNTNATLQEILRRVDAQNTSGVPFTLVTISFDPAHDTPQELAAYAAGLGAAPDRWHFATHPDEALLKQLVGGGFEVFYQADSQGGFDFTPTFVLVDGWGIIRGQYAYETLASDADRIARHVGVLLEEIENSQGAARLVYEAAHLFLCYPK